MCIIIYNTTDIEEVLADARAWILKVVFFAHPQNALDAKRSKEEREHIMQQMFELTKQVLKEDTDLLALEDMLYYHMMVVRKKM